MVQVRHAKVVTQTDNPSKSVSSGEWNADHVLSMATGRILARTSPGDGAAEEVTGNQAAALMDSFSATQYKLGSGAFNQQSGTGYALQTSDNGRVVILTNASPITLSVPAGLGTGFSCMIIQGGVGQVTVAAGGGTTMGSFSGFTKLAGAFAVGILIAPTANNFILSGTISA
jgi:hypothetical protein